MKKKHVVLVGTEEYGLGREPLVRDDRDWLLRNVPAERKNRADLAGSSRYWSMVSPDFRMDQGAEGTCVGHGCTNVLLAGPTPHLYFPEFVDIENAHQYSRRLYLEASGDTSYQQGTYTRLALDVLRKWGRISAYYRLTSVDEIIDTVLHVGPVTFGTLWYYSMFRTYDQYENQYVRVSTSSGIAGGHLYCLTGVNLAPKAGPPFLRMENSWGPGWGHNGTARITIDDAHVLFDGDCFLLTETVF